MGDGISRVALAGEDEAHRILAQAVLEQAILAAAGERGSGWPEAEQLDQARCWYRLPAAPDRSGAPFYKTSRLDEDLKQVVGPKFFRVTRFEGKPLGEASTLIDGYRLFALQPDPPDAVLLLRDSDGDPERAAALPVGQRWLDMHRRVNPEAPVAAFGVAEPEAEAWFIACLTPAPERLAAARDALSFDPVRQPERLTSLSASATSDAKRALRFLAGEGIALDERVPAVALKAHELETLAADVCHSASQRAASCGLSRFLAEIELYIIPRVFQS